MADNKFFTNTYITGKGRRNYQIIKDLEDPLFTSFTFDIDFLTSPLFYTIYNYYDEDLLDEQKNSNEMGNGLAGRIENALKEMHDGMEGDQGYDILPVMSKSGNFGFGLQQNVYIDTPLYGATEYIYMVDKRNGTADQNDVKGGTIGEKDYTNSNKLNKSIKLGDSVKSINNESDKKWAEKQKEMNEQQKNACEEILRKPEVINEHKSNESEYKTAKEEYENIKVELYNDNSGKKYSEEELQQEIKRLKVLETKMEDLKGKIASWVNSELTKYQNQGKQIYNDNPCVKKILSYNDISFCNEEQISKYAVELRQTYGSDYDKKYISESYFLKFENLYNEVFNDENKNTNLVWDGGQKGYEIDGNKLYNKFGDDVLKEFDIKNFHGKVKVIPTKSAPDWVNKSEYLRKFGAINLFSDTLYLPKIKTLMTLYCDVNLCFENFTSDKIKQNKDELGKFNAALTNIQYQLYGTVDGNYDKSNPSPDSAYGKYKAAKEKLENDAYSQAEKEKEMAESGLTEMTNMLNEFDPMYDDNTYNDMYKTSAGGSNLSSSEPNYVPQTVYDMLGFISGMKKMTINYPYIIQGITGLDTAYNKHYGIKDPYLGSGDDKITLTCLESLDLRVSSMFNRYFNAVYDRQYRRERVPINLRRFNCSVFVHDVRHFNPLCNIGNTKISEIRDMYFSAIEFRFYDCEIVPEETGNIFNDISNEAPSEMKKTNFTFKYGNCVVNFLPVK
jgi:hypothetical protein